MVFPCEKLPASLAVVFNYHTGLENCFLSVEKEVQESFRLGRAVRNPYRSWVGRLAR